MGKIYFTIAGTKYHFGQEYFEPKMEVKLVKEPRNVEGHQINRWPSFVEF